MVYNVLLVLGLVTALLVFLFVLIIAVNIFQNGGRWTGKTLDEILGMNANEATCAHIRNFSKARLMQLFYASVPPDKAILNGEIEGFAPAVGVFFPFAAFFLKSIYGQGVPWTGKAFRPEGTRSDPEYNLFRGAKSDVVQRKRLMDSYLEKSALDDKQSLHLTYTAYNKDSAGLLHDEVRMINRSLYIGVGYLTIPGGYLNPIPFILYGDVKPWVGPDKAD